MSVVAAEGVWKHYGEFAALRNIRLEVEAGRCLALLGRNGAGKTTLLRCLAGLSPVSEGRVRIAGGSPRDAGARRQLATLGHGIGVYDELSAEENLLLFARLYGVADAKARVQRWLERVSLDAVASHAVREFSRGMRQRMAIARAFLHDPKVLLLDEPFTSLDDRSIAMLETLLREALEGGATVILSTHQLREALELATDVAVMERGAVVYSGLRTPEMAADPGLVYRMAEA